MSPLAPTTGLRDHLLSSLSTVPNTHNLQVVALSSTPKRTTSLFPHALTPPRCFQVDYFVVLGTEIAPPATISTEMTTSTTIDTESKSELPLGEPKTAGTFVLTCALSAHLYILPQSHTSILYISKVDSSSYPSSTSIPFTRTLITSFISYFLLPSTRPTPFVRVQLFARSQGQYLFPNSEKGKKGLGGARLCGWWKGVYEDVARGLVGPGGLESREIRLSYLLPSYSDLEAAGLLGLPRQPLPIGLEWKYEAPFSLPIPGIGQSKGRWEEGMSLADLIPSLEDDPKTRFLEEVSNQATEELAVEEKGSKQVKSKAKQSSSQLPPPSESSQTLASSSSLPLSTPSTLNPASSQSPKINLAVKHRSSKDSKSVASTQPTSSQSTENKQRSSKNPKILSAQEDEEYRRQAHHNLTKITPGEFWERIGYRGECAFDVTGFFTLSIFPSPSSSLSTQDPVAAKGHLPTAITDRIQKALMNTDFSTLEWATQGSEDWLVSTRQIIQGEIGQEAMDNYCVGIVMGKTKEELEILGKEGGKRGREMEVVTVLQPRKKKKM